MGWRLESISWGNLSLSTMWWCLGFQARWEWAGFWWLPWTQPIHTHCVHWLDRSVVLRQQCQDNVFHRVSKCPWCWAGLIWLWIVRRSHNGWEVNQMGRTHRVWLHDLNKSKHWCRKLVWWVCDLPSVDGASFGLSLWQIIIWKGDVRWRTDLNEWWWVRSRLNVGNSAILNRLWKLEWEFGTRQGNTAVQSSSVNNKQPVNTKNNIRMKRCIRHKEINETSKIAII